MENKKKETVPIFQKALLTVVEASELTNIGQNRIREIIESPNCNFVLHVGCKRLIKRELFLDYINRRKVL